MYCKLDNSTETKIITFEGGRTASLNTVECIFAADGIDSVLNWVKISDACGLGWSKM